MDTIPDFSAPTIRELIGIALIVLGGFVGIYILLAIWTGGW